MRWTRVLYQQLRKVWQALWAGRAREGGGYGRRMLWGSETMVDLIYEHVINA